jgi:hypothetical protein
MRIFDNGDKGFFVKCTPDEKAKLIEALKRAMAKGEQNETD